MARLSERLGGTAEAHFPVIPLGIETSDFAHLGTREARQAARARLGIGADAFVIVYLGRLSWHSKAHPVPLYQAAEAAARRIGRPLF